MDNLSIRILLPLIISFIASLAIMPAIRQLSFRTHHVVMPRSGRWHQNPTPTLGGVGIFIAFLATLFASYLLVNNQDLFVKRWSILLGILIMFFIGLYDDLKHINPPTKLVFQILAATLVIFFGDNIINFFRWPIANILLTFFWLVGITNGFNLLDNMDGLAGGVAFIASAFLSVFFYQAGNIDLLILSLTLAGSTLGFLVFNFPPARLFMGDSGSVVLGFTLASLAVAQRAQASDVLAIMGVPILIFMLPILDTTLVAVTRILRGQSPTTGGTDHTSHRLVAYGLSERQALLVLYSIAIISGIASIGLEAWDYDLSLVLIPILLIVLSLFVAYLARLKVVTTDQNNQTGFTRWIINLTYKRRVFELVFDLLLIGVSYYIAYWTYYGLDMTSKSMALFMISWPIALGITYGSFYLLRIYRGVWRYIGINDLIRYVIASIMAGGLSWLFIKFILPDQEFPAGVFLLFTIFLIIGLAGSRASFLFLDRIYGKQFSGVERYNILLYGADDAGEIALRWILRNPSIGYNVVGFIDPDSLKWGSNIHGVDILGDVDMLKQYIKSKNIRGVIVTTENLLDSPDGEKLKTDCYSNKVWVKVLRLEFEPVD
jgi:UDP-GlcNAc:undecaprenyl-phosphate/decaprenyl-phosphate GlcNAc-1-phosphate transferase